MAKNDFRFEVEDCIRCFNEEKDELVDGKPPCKIEGYCKHFANAKSSAPPGNPVDYLHAGGLWEFEKVSDRIINLSSWDGSKLPSVDFYPHAVGSVPMSEKTFQNCLSIKLNAIRNRIITDRNRMIESQKAKYGA